MLAIIPDEIDAIFAKHDHENGRSAEIVLDLYKLVFDGSAPNQPNWDDIEKINGWPLLAKNAAQYITKKFVAFDQKHYPNVIPGGLWAISGFLTDHDDKLPTWSCDPSNAIVTLKGD